MCEIEKSAKYCQTHQTKAVLLYYHFKSMHWLLKTRTVSGTDLKSALVQANTSNKTNLCYQSSCGKCAAMSGRNQTEKMHESNILLNNTDNKICYLTIIKLEEFVLVCLFWGDFLFVLVF